MSLLDGHGGAYPLTHHNDDTATTAQTMPFAETINGVTYHINRYGDNGLYGINDPAERPLRNDTIALKDRFHGLRHPGTALVVAISAKNLPETIKGEEL